MDLRYEEALERCKKEFDFNNLAYSHEEIKQRLEIVFPELRGSEDERIINAVLKAIMTDEGREAMENSGFKVEDVLSWFKSPKDRVQPKPKQEWSEEDETRFKNLCSIIDDSKWNKASKDGFKNWLKSLKPNNYKPSKEQMDALDKAKNYPGLYYDIRLGLQSLYNDLSKL